MEEDAYAIWLTLSSIISWVIMFDIGIGNGLRNKLAETLAQNDIHEGKEYVSTAYISILVIGILAIVIFVVASNFISWQKILNASFLSEKELGVLATIVFISFTLQFQLGLLNSVLLALQLSSMTSVISCSGQIISYIAVLIMVKLYHINDILPLATVISIVPVVTYLIASLIVFGGKYNFLRPSISSFSKHKIKDILSLGLKFFWLQIVTIILFQTNNFIINYFIDANAVVTYNIVYKYFYTLVSIYILICIPFWSASTNAYHNGDLLWIKRVHKKLNIIAMLFTLVGIVMFGFSSLIYKFWVGEDCPLIHWTTSVLMLIYSISMIFYSCNGYIINGIGKLYLQTIITTILAIFYIPLSVFLGKEFGLNGVLIALTVNGIVNAIWSKVQLSKIINSTATGYWLR